MAITPDLQRVVNDAVEPWRSSATKPPFAPDELSVMALILHDEPLSTRDIVRWIFKTFEYFNKSESRLWERVQGYFREFNHALTRYELPIEEFNCDDGKCKRKLEMPDAGIYVRARFGRWSLQGTFPILSLPSEVLTIIYEMVFTLPPSGVIYTSFRDEPHLNLRTLKRDFTKGFSVEAWEHEPWYEVSPPKELLTLLLANKQLYREAMPIFYSINTFVVFCLHDLEVMLARLPPTRRQHLSHVALMYHLIQAPWALNAFKLLRSITNLRQVHIHMGGESWSHSGWRKPSTSDPRKIPSLRVLQSMKDRVEIEFEGDCSSIAALVKSEAEIPALEERSLQS